jgi:Domain of unknown function (DUF5658)
MIILFVFLALQFCDLATTLIFLRHGVGEANPLVATLIHTSASPALSVLGAKFAACGFALVAWKFQRTRLLRRANLFYALCVGWNLLAIVRV